MGRGVQVGEWVWWSGAWLVGKWVGRFVGWRWVMVVWSSVECSARWESRGPGAPPLALVGVDE